MKRAFLMSLDYDSMKKINVSRSVNTGGREGESVAPDGSFSVKTSMTKNKDATTPEMLFAAGFAACFNSAMSFTLQQAGKGDLHRQVTANVDLYAASQTDFNLKVRLVGHIDGVEPAETQKYMEETAKVCPYSKAVAGNIDVEVSAE